MNGIRYHEMKGIIEKRIEEYSIKHDAVNLPEIKIEKKKKNTDIIFSLNNDADMYKIVKIFVSSLGSMEISESISTIYLKSKNVRIHIHDSLYKGVTLSKPDDLTSEEIESVLQAYFEGNSIKGKLSPSQRLIRLGVSIYDSKKAFNWDYIAGYEKVKQEIKDTIILPLKYPQIYEDISKGTRKIFENIRPKAVLFEGPPGTGKTTLARIISGEIDNNMIYVPVESIITKWYGESERNLAEIFDACHDLGDSLIFLDEIDSLAMSRNRNMHEATRRVLSVLLRKIDGFEANNKTILVGATNRKNDLDPALLSRFDVSINFPLPNLKERKKIFHNYAKHLGEKDLEQLARESESISGRNIKDVCEHAERSWASKLIRKAKIKKLPSINEYIDSLKTRKMNEI